MLTGKKANVVVVDGLDDEPVVRMTARLDRETLGLSIAEYDKIAAAMAIPAYINKVGDPCNFKNASTGKLKQLKTSIKRDPMRNESMLWKEMLRVLEKELGKRRLDSRFTANQKKEKFGK